MQIQIKTLKDQLDLQNSKMDMEIRAKVAEAKVEFLTTGRVGHTPSASSGHAPSPMPFQGFGSG